jgi:hypothetical protein
MRIAASRNIDTSMHHSAKNPDEGLWWLLRALRAIRLVQPHVLDRCCRVVTTLVHLLDTEPGDLSQLLHRIASLSRRSAAEKLHQVQANADLPEYARRQKVARLTRLLRTWAPARRNVALPGVRFDSGRFSDEP